MNKNSNANTWSAAAGVLFFMSMLTGLIMMVLNNAFGGQLAFLHAWISQAIGIVIGFFLVAYGAAHGMLKTSSAESASLTGIISAVIVIALLGGIPSIPLVILWNGLGFTPAMNFVQVAVSTAIGATIGLVLAMLVEKSQEKAAENDGNKPN